MNEETPKVSPNDLVERNGIYYKKFTNVPFTGSAEEYFDNGSLHWKETYKDGKEDGIWEYYHENGQLWKKVTYKNGNLDGVVEHYYDNGQLWIKETYKNGKIINHERF